MLSLFPKSIENKLAQNELMTFSNNLITFMKRLKELNYFCRIIFKAETNT